MDLIQIGEAILNFLSSILTGIINGLLQIGEGLYNGVMWVIQTVLRVLEWLYNGITDILRFFGELILTIINTVIQIVGGAFVLVFMFIQTLVNFLIDMIANIIKVIEVVRLTVEAGFSIAGLVFLYLGQMIQFMFGIYQGINGAQPAPLPGVPQCITAPTEWDWCAIWYITDWTIFAPDTPGAHIIPIVVLIIDLFIIAYIVRSVFKLVRWFQSLYQVT